MYAILPEVFNWYFPLVGECILHRKQYTKGSNEEKIDVRRLT